MAETSCRGGPAWDRGAVPLGPVERETELRLKGGGGEVADGPVGIGVASKKERSAMKPRTICGRYSLQGR